MKRIRAPVPALLLAVLVVEHAAGQQGTPPPPANCTTPTGEAPWCASLGGVLCSAEGAPSTRYRISCPSTCRACEPYDAAVAEALKTELTSEFRTGFVLTANPDEDALVRSRLRGWDTWLRYTGADTVGIPVGNGFVRINHTSVVATSDVGAPDCAEYARLAQTLIGDHKIQAAVITHNNCKTQLSQTYHEGGVLHLIQSGTPMTLQDGSEYLNKHSWFMHLDSNEYPQLFLQSMSRKGHRKVAVLWRASHPWTSSSSKYIIDNYISKYNMELAYADSYEQGAGSISGADDEYLELYDTGVWDAMLQEAADSGAEVLVVYCIGEGASILKRMKALGISFEGVFMTVSPTWPTWPALMGTDGDYVITPAQWSEKGVTPCDVFGSSTEYAAVYEKFNNLAAEYTAASFSAAGVTFQLAIQEQGSTDPEKLLAAIKAMSRDTMIGRLRFSFAQRNFGRPPVGLQHQNGVSYVVYPEAMAQTSVQPFVDWGCREFFKARSQQCTDDQLATLRRCSAKYRGLQLIADDACSISTGSGASKFQEADVPRPAGSPRLSGGIAVAASVVVASLLAGVVYWGVRKRRQQELARDTPMSDGPDFKAEGTMGGGAGKAVVRESRAVQNLNSRSSFKGIASDSAKSAQEGMEVDVEELIGKGGGGVVYKGMWHGVLVALKICRLPVKDEAQGSEAQELFTMESGIGEALRHPNVVQLFGSSVAPVTRQAYKEEQQLEVAEDSYNDVSSRGLPKDETDDARVVLWEARIIQEYCCHGDLRYALKKGKLKGQRIGEDGKASPPDRGTALRLALDAASGMAYIHTKKVIHGDLKASNILLSDRPSGSLLDCRWMAKVSDFGLAMVMDNDVSHVSGVFAGTITHSAPECLRSGRQSQAADVYAFGILLYELFTARSAYPGKSTVWIINNVVNKQARPVFPPDTPLPVLQLFSRCTHHDASLRPTMDDVWVCVDALLTKHSADPMIRCGSETRRGRRVVSSASTSSLVASPGSRPGSQLGDGPSRGAPRRSSTAVQLGCGTSGRTTLHAPPSPLSLVSSNGAHANSCLSFTDLGNDNDDGSDDDPDEHDETNDETFVIQIPKANDADAGDDENDRAGWAAADADAANRV
eukprot:jgi/Tetstr1/458507/TSEL_044913.t1